MKGGRVATGLFKRSNSKAPGVSLSNTDMHERKHFGVGGHSAKT